MAGPPSNGTMGDLWLAEWCSRCVHDHAASHVEDGPDDWENGCELLARMYLGGPGEDFVFLVDHHGPDELAWNPAKLECTAFALCPCVHDPRWEPEPRPHVEHPVHPGQGVLFDLGPGAVSGSVVGNWRPITTVRVAGETL